VPGRRLSYQATTSWQEHRGARFAPERLERSNSCILVLTGKREPCRAAAVVLTCEHHSAHAPPATIVERDMSTPGLTGGRARRQATEAGLRGADAPAELLHVGVVHRAAAGKGGLGGLLAERSARIGEGGRQLLLQGRSAG
jgi:hypothetical protein